MFRRYSQRRISISRTLSAVLAILTILAAGVVFEEKREAGRMSSEVARLKRGIEHEKERISELNAEWALLDQPARLQGIVEANKDTFPLHPIEPTQIGRVGDLPWRPAPEPEEPAGEGDPAAAPGNGEGATPAPAMAAPRAPAANDPVARLLRSVEPSDPATTGSVTSPAGAPAGVAPAFDLPADGPSSADLPPVE